MILSRVPGGRRSRARPGGPRRGLAAVELALLLPMLIFMCMVTVDFARIIYVTMILQNCARNGALYEFYEACGYSLPSGWSSLSAAVASDAGTVTVTIPSSYGGNANPYSPKAASNNYVTVTVQSQFTLISLGSDRGFPSFGGTMTLSQSVSMPLPASAAAP